MKKISLLLCAGLCALCTFAQESNVVLPSSAVITPSNYGSTDEFGVDSLTNVNSTITVEFDKAPSVDVTVMYITGSGFGINMTYKRLPANGTTLEIPLNRESWGVPFNEEFSLNLGITFTYGEGDDIEYYLNEDEEPVMFEAMYTTHDNGPAEFVRSYPTGEWETYYTFEDAYNDGIATLYFTKTVKLGDVIGSIKYYVDGDLDQEIEISSFEDAWSEWDGLYVINFLWNSEDYCAEDLSEVVIDFANITYDGKNVSVPSIVYKNELNESNRRAKKSANTAKLNKLSLDNKQSSDIYNLQGVLVKKNASAQDFRVLPKGIYIVNGIKMVVR